MTWIKSLIGSFVHPVLANETSAATIWRNLEIKLLPRMEIYAKTLRDRLQEMKKTKDHSMTDYLLKIRALADNLIGSGLTMTDWEVFGYALDGLPPDFSSFATMVNAQKGLAYDDVCHLLMVEYLTVRCQNLGVASVVNSILAFAAQ